MQNPSPRKAYAKLLDNYTEKDERLTKGKTRSIYLFGRKPQRDNKAYVSGWERIWGAPKEPLPFNETVEK